MSTAPVPFATAESGSSLTVTGSPVYAASRVAPPAATLPRVTAPNLAAGGNKPTSGLGYEVMTSTSDIATDTQGVLEVYCSAGKRAIGGGFFIDGGVPINGPDVYVYESSHRVTGGTDGWRLAAMNRTGGTRQFNVYAICAAI